MTATILGVINKTRIYYFFFSISYIFYVRHTIISKDFIGGLCLAVAQYYIDRSNNTSVVGPTITTNKKVHYHVLQWRLTH
ncbi:MAG: hypothetical protein ACI90V_012667 [Bacillariaceae sp.]|jgi:hypothetical protein